MKLQYTYIIALLICSFSAVSHAMDKEQSNSSQQPSQQVFGLDALPSEFLPLILDKLAPKSNGYVYAYTKEQSNKCIAAFAALRRTCKKFHSFITLAKFAELFTHEELSNVYYNKVCTSDINTPWLYLVAKCVGPTIQCPSCLLSDWKPKAADDKKLPDNKIPCEYFLAHVIHRVESEDTVLSVLKTLVAAGTKVTFDKIEIDEWLFNCVAHAAPLYNAINREFRSVVQFLVSRGAFIEESHLTYAETLRPGIYSLLKDLQKQQNDNAQFCALL